MASHSTRATRQPGGNYAKHFSNGAHLIVLDPDLAAEFPDSKAVSRALRAYLKTRPKRRTA